MYTLIDENGRPVGLPASFPPEDSDGDWRPLVMPPPRVSECQTLEWELIDGACHGKWVGSADPGDRLATRSEINAARDRIEEFPLLTSFGLMDADQPKSEQRMRGMINGWDAIGVNEVNWVRADNSIVSLTKPDVEQLLQEILTLRAMRGLLVHSQAHEMKSSGTTTINQVNAWENSFLSGEF